MGEGRIGLSDPDDWRGWWGRFHDSEECDPKLAVFARDLLVDPSVPEGVGSVMLNVDDGEVRVDVELRYALEEYPTGRVLHVLSIQSPGDPRPPWLRDRG